MFSKRVLAFVAVTVSLDSTTVSSFTPAGFRGGSLSSNTATRCDATKSADFCVGVLGDLHIDPRKMEDYYTGRSQWLPIFEEAKQQHGNVALVSLGDLGESKSVRPDETQELFAGTTECHEMAAEFLGSFDVPYELVGGNHGTYIYVIYSTKKRWHGHNLSTCYLLCESRLFCLYLKRFILYTYYQ
jgi:hypothetical protein